MLDVGLEGGRVIIVPDHDIIETVALSISILIDVHDLGHNAFPGGDDRSSDGHFKIVGKLVGVASRSAIGLKNGVGRADRVGQGVKRLGRVAENGPVQTI
jgi:hypothetical protein